MEGIFKIKMLSLSTKINKFKWTENTAIFKVISDFSTGKHYKFKYKKFIMYFWLENFLLNIFIMPLGYHYEIKNT